MRIARVRFKQPVRLLTSVLAGSGEDVTALQPGSASPRWSMEYDSALQMLVVEHLATEPHPVTLVPRESISYMNPEPGQSRKRAK